MSEEKTPRKKITNQEWAEIAALWELGDITLESLAERCGLDKSTLSRRLSAGGHQKGSKAGQIIEQIQQQVIDTAVEAAAEEALKIAAKKKATKEDSYTWSEVIQKATMNIVVGAIKSKQPLAAFKGDLVALEKAMNIIASGRKERFEILGLDKEDIDPNEIPELIVRELTTDEIAKMRDDDDDEDDDLDVDLDALQEGLDG